MFLGQQQILEAAANATYLLLLMESFSWEKHIMVIIIFLNENYCGCLSMCVFLSGGRHSKVILLDLLFYVRSPQFKGGLQASSVWVCLYT